MRVVYGVLLGLLQGVTEFLPVSSSGHLALAQLLIPGFHQPGVVFDAVLHLGTAAAVLWYERRSLVEWAARRSGWRLAGLMVLATLVTAAVGLPLRHVAEGAFSRALWVGLCLVVTGGVVLASRWLSGGEDGESSTSWGQATVVGLAQGLSVFPGISRSGSTIVVGLGAGLERRWAARFSFLLSVPAIAGATLVELVGARSELAAQGPGFWPMCTAGVVAAALSGYVALRVVIGTVTSRHFHRFAAYCLPLGALVVGLALGGVL